MNFSQKMKHLLLLLTILGFYSCSSDLEINSHELISCDSLKEINGVWILDDKPYSGYCERVDELGCLSSSEFNNGLIHGEMKFYFSNGQLNESVEWIKGKAKGQVKYYYENGIIKEEGIVDDNIKIGEWKQYFPSGSVKEIQNWKNNQIVDSIFCFYENGNLYSKGFFINGKEDGRWILYDSISEDIIDVLIYKDGSPIRIE